jgi:hypothetical protein
VILSLIPILRFLLPKHITAITLWPFIFFREKVNKTDLIIINHEKIHLKQQLELLIIPFYLLYLIEYVLGLLKYRNHDKAYRNISFEKEAYKHEKNLEYLGQRKTWAVWRTT